MVLRLVHSAPLEAAPPRSPPVLEYEHRACHVCRATTDDQAARACVQSSDQTGERWCVGGAEEKSYPDGRLRFITPASLVALDAWIDEEVAREMLMGPWP